MKKYLIITTSILLLAAGCAKQPVSVVPNPQSAPNPAPSDQTANWNTYKSPDKYGFKIEYPNDFGFSTDINQIKALSYLPVCQSTLACIYLSRDNYQGTNFDAAAVNILILDSKNSEAGCYNFKDQYSYTQTDNGIVKINGTDFHASSGSDGAMSHDAILKAFRNFHNGICYEVDEGIYETNIGVYEPGTVKSFDADAVWQKLLSVVNTFEFVSGSVTRDEAVRLVSNLPEVKNYIKDLKGKAQVAAALQDAGSAKPYWVVQVYENLSDHNSTFGWYEVDQNTGTIEKQ